MHINLQRHHWDCSRVLEQRKRGREVVLHTSKSRFTYMQTQFAFELGQKQNVLCT